MENNQNIFPFRRLPSVTVDIEEIHTTADFEVIDIVDESNPYPSFLGLDWEFENMAIINLKKRQMLSEGNKMRIIIPLDPSEGVRYTKPVREEYCVTDIDNIYQIIGKEQDCVNPTTEGKLSWENDSSCTSDSEEE